MERWREKEFSLQTTLIFLFYQLGFGRDGRRSLHLAKPDFPWAMSAEPAVAGGPCPPAHPHAERVPPQAHPKTDQKRKKGPGGIPSPSLAFRLHTEMVKARL